MTCLAKSLPSRSMTFSELAEQVNDL
jgi:hypothetical protein